MKRFFSDLFGKFQHKTTEPESYIPDLDDGDELDFTVADEGFEDDNTFINSLEMLSEEDVPLSPGASAKKKSPMDIVRTCVFYISAAVFVVSCILLLKNVIDQYRGDAIYSELQDMFLGDGFDMTLSDSREDGDALLLSKDHGSSGLSTMTDAVSKLASGESIEIPVQDNYNEDLAKMRARLQSLATINEDIYGWIHVDGTNIDYPLVQGDDNDFYLDHAFTGDPLVIGSIFVDYRNDDMIMRNYNTVFYGHNITSGKMFHDVENFFKDEYFYNKLIYVYTLDGIYIYEPFAIYQSRYDNNYFKTGFTSFDDFLEFTEKVKGDATKLKDLEFAETDRMITLSTCTNGAATDRYALHAKLVDYIID
ncbi:MAG: class B sortase [Clostridia bacterium]|nr:class B sortase [Clostridia bacterium]